MGQNPTSGVLSLERRRELYSLCSKYDILIVEDDPYWYLQYPTSTHANTTTTSSTANTSYNPECPMFANAEARPTDWKSSGFDFLDSLVPSYISIDTDGRVIRLDTFSKTVAPGCRLGWISAQPAIVERILRITETSTQQPSGFVQSMISELILGPDQSGLTTSTSKSGKGNGGLPSGRGWKASGWVRWLEGLRGNYERRMQHMSRILTEGSELVKTGRRQSLSNTSTDNEDEDEWHVIEKTRMFSFVWPVGGMFIWLKVLFESHPLYNTYAKSNELARLSRGLWVLWTTEPYRVLVSPGTIFAPNDGIRNAEGYKYFRLCFAAIDEEMLGPVTESLVQGVRAFWRIKDKGVVERLLEEDEKGVVGIMGQAEMAQMVGPC